MKTVSFATLVASLVLPTLAFAEPTSEPTSSPGAAFVGGARFAGILPVNGLSAFPGGGVDVGVALPPMNRAFVLLATGDYTAPSATGTVSTDPRVQGRTTSWDVRTKQLTVGPLLLFRLPAMGALRLHAGVGALLAFQRSTANGTVSGASLLPTEETKSALGGQLVLGAGYTLGPGHLVGEVRVSYTGLSHTITGDAGFPLLSLSIGYRFEFPNASSPTVARRASSLESQ